jgi:formamidopyrimidine-DNA glycosylase
VPELPEVETIRRDLCPLLTGRTIAAVAVDPATAPLLLDRSPDAFQARLCGRTVRSVGRRGKYLLFGLDDGATWVVHLRMTGRLLWRQRDAPEEPYQRAAVAFDGGHGLRWSDVRKFGTWRIAERLDDPTPALGPEPLDEEFTAGWLAGQLQGRTAPLKSFLLDQRRIAGLGNIYADEALFAAGIHPLLEAGAVGADQVTRLRDACATVLREGIEHRGASFRDYVDASGNAGSVQGHVRVFRRTGRPCYTCGIAIERIVVGGRATHFCPVCQPRPPGGEGR